MNLNPLREPSRFETFWSLANAVRREAGKPELGLASARHLFTQMRERDPDPKEADDH